MQRQGISGFSRTRVKSRPILKDTLFAGNYKQVVTKVDSTLSIPLQISFKVAYLEGLEMDTLGKNLEGIPWQNCMIT